MDDRIGSRSTVVGLVLAAALPLGVAAAAPPLAIGSLPAVGEHHGYRYRWDAGPPPLHLTASARFDVARTAPDTILVTDREHAPAPVALHITADGLEFADAAPGSASSLPSASAAPAQIVRREQTGPNVPVAVPPPEYARVVRLAQAVADAPLGTVRSVPGCTPSDAWTARLDEALDGGRRLVAHCNGRETFSLGASSEPAVSHVEQNLTASFDAAGRFTSAQGDAQRTTETGHGPPAILAADWSIVADD